MGNTVAVRVGRLLEIRVGAGYRSLSDVDALFRQIARFERPVPERFVTVTDWRCCPVMAADAAQRVLEGMTRNNPLMERSAALASLQSPVAVLQFVRLVRESNDTRRRLFYDADALIGWLAQVLTPEETQRLREFLLEGGAPAG